MRRHLLVSTSSALVWSAFPLVAAGESFEVIVLRGSEVAKVIGDSDGTVSEITLRKAPTLPAMPPPSEEEAEPVANPPDELVVVVNQILPTVVGVGAVPFHPTLGKPIRVPPRTGRIHGRGIRDR